MRSFVRKSRCSSRHLFCLQWARQNDIMDPFDESGGPFNGEMHVRTLSPFSNDEFRNKVLYDPACQSSAVAGDTVSYQSIQSLYCDTMQTCHNNIY